LVVQIALGVHLKSMQWPSLVQELVPREPSEWKILVGEIVARKMIAGYPPSYQEPPGLVGVGSSVVTAVVVVVVVVIAVAAGVAAVAAAVVVVVAVGVAVSSAAPPSVE